MVKANHGRANDFDRGELEKLALKAQAGISRKREKNRQQNDYESPATQGVVYFLNYLFAVRNNGEGIRRSSREFSWSTQIEREEVAGGAHQFLTSIFFCFSRDSFVLIALLFYQPRFFCFNHRSCFLLKYFVFLDESFFFGQKKFFFH